MAIGPNTDWSSVKHFKPEEWVLKPALVSTELVLLVDDFRDWVGKPFHIHVAWDANGHEVNSEHYLGLAVDLHVEGLTLLDQWLAAERFPFRGIGVYPYWNSPGLHLDIRRSPRVNLGYRWWKDKDGAYKPLDRACLQVLMETS